jgi:hypothetical protein
MRAGGKRTACVLALVGVLVTGMTATAQAGPPPALNVVPPVITGVPLTGQTLSYYQGFWTRGGTPYVFEQTWLRCDATGANCVSTGVTTKTYTVTAADVGHTIRVRVTCRGDNGNGVPVTVTSQPTAPVAA